MNRTRFASAILALLVSASAARAAVTITDTGYQDLKDGKHVVVQRTFVIETGARDFILRTNGCALGWSGVSWHSGELCIVDVNGERFFGFTGAARKDGFKPKTQFKVTRGAEAVSVEAAQDGAKARAVLTFAARKGDDRLELTVKIEPKQKVRSAWVGFECYPSTTLPRAKLARAAATAQRTQVNEPGKGGAPLVLKKDEPWVFLHDAAFDLGARTTGGGKARGGCGLFYVPAETRAARVIMGPLHLDPRFVFAPNVTEMHFALLDFAGKKSNADALAYMKALAAKGYRPGAAGEIKK